MGYSRNIETLKQRIALGWFDRLLKSGPTKWETQEGQAHTLAYQIRECFYIARLYPKGVGHSGDTQVNFKDLAEASKLYTIEIVSNSVVQARRKQGTTETTVLSVGAPMVNTGMENAKATNLSGQHTADSVIAHIKSQQPSNEKFFFPQALLNNDDMMKLYGWAQTATPPWLLFEADGQLTVMRWTRDHAAYAWSPEDIGLEVEDVGGDGTGEIGSADESLPREGHLQALPGEDSVELRSSLRMLSGGTDGEDHTNFRHETGELREDAGQLDNPALEDDEE
jgi:hypothetical protein